MDGIDLTELSKKYEGFYEPLVKVYVDGTDIEEDKKVKMRVTDVSVSITSDYKASIAEYSLIYAYNVGGGAFRTSDIKKYISMGTCISIYMGHANKIGEVFKGFIAGVNFLYNNDSFHDAAIRITAFDVKGIMMANNRSKRLKANYYSDAVKEILNQQTYQNLQNNKGISSITINDTPDKPKEKTGNEQADNRLEMVAESDYDFVVKAAKKFNYEFFTIGGHVVFRKAKSDKKEIGTLSPHKAILSYDIGYDITGVVGEIVVRTLDIGKASKIEVKKKNNAKYSIGTKAKPLVTNQTYVYVDSAIESQKDAENRAAYLLEETSYRLGSLKLTLKGLPEIFPGKFIVLKGFGDGASNKFYVTDVEHEYDGHSYTTTIIGKASTL
ncbi:MAG: phage late control D family protein [Butyrivibrio sp.]|uniref:phage late control D family protein n=1 Tax=Butyrivibrio sp. TaxID=28121 RepID=UPI001B033E2A|nr:hypothetical protein [Butyrivibrio sp.]MBO6241271.1 phage late control D family protein [Butyrivibrio sp.]